MPKLTLDDITSGYASITQLNDNFAAIETAIENTVSRDGTTPNQMTADLDMNSNNLLNISTFQATSLNVDNLYIGGELVTPTSVALSAVPDPTGQNNKVLKSDNISAGWETQTAVDVTYTPAGVGAVDRTVQSKLREVISVSDYDTLVNARTEAGFIKEVVDPIKGRSYLPHSETYDLAATVLSVGQYWNPSATVHIPDGKQNDLFRYSATIEHDGNTGSNASVFTLHNAQLTLTGTQGTGSANNYTFIGNLTNSGDFTSKALYGRANAASGCTGVVMGAVLRTQIDTGATPSYACPLQIGHAGDPLKPLDAVIQIDTEATSAKSVFGILSDIAVGYTTAFIRACAGGGGLFLKWQAAGGGATLFSVNDAGDVFTNTKLAAQGTVITPGKIEAAGNLVTVAESASTLYLGAGTAYPVSVTGTKITVDNNSSKRLNFSGSGATTVGAAGAASALPANPLGYIIMQVNGSDVKVPYYNV